MAKKTHRNLPLTEVRHPAKDQFVLIGAVDAVAVAADPSFDRLVDVQIVQIGVAVAKAGRFRGPLVFELAQFGMATETEGEVFRIVGGVKFPGIIALEQRAIGRGMVFVTIPATPFGHRLVLGGSGFDGGADAAVAAEADAVAGRAEQARLVAAMGHMAIIAAPGPHRTMHPAGCADFTMTGAAERTLLGNEQMGLGGPVGGMASKTLPFGHRRMPPGEGSIG